MRTPAETWQFIVDQCAECEKAEKLSDAELAETLQRKIADHINMDEPAFALIAEAADRLAKSQPTPTVAKIAEEVAADLGDYVKDDYGFRTADAQEMIERAFAPLEKENTKLAQQLKESHESIQSSANVVASMQTELEQANNALEEMTAAAGAMNLETIDLRAHLATAEADKQALQELLLKRDAEIASLIWDMESGRSNGEPWSTARIIAALDQAINKAKA